MAITEGDMIRVDEFTYLYHLKESKEYGYYKHVPWVRKARIITDLPSSFRYWKSRFFFVSGDGWETPSNEFWGDIPRLLCRWRAPSLSASSFCKSFFFFFWFVANLSVCCVCTVKKRLKLKNRYKRHVEAATEYAKTIDDFDDLVDPRTLARHCLSPKPSSFVLHAIEIEEKSKCYLVRH